MESAGTRAIEHVEEGAVAKGGTKAEAVRGAAPAASGEGSPKVNRKYKDSMFRDLFGAPERKRNALELYNALNGTSYEDEDVIEVTTLDDALFVNVRNDVSLLIDGDAEMAMWEHQSTYNPNMPLRGLIYYAHLYGAYVKQTGQDIRSSSLVRLPRPTFVVLYNGKRAVADRETLLLSSAYEGKGCIEVEAELVNVNEGHNQELMDACAALRGYARFVGLTREYHEAQGLPLGEACDRAADRCIEEGLLVDYLQRRWKDVREMFVFGYTLEELEAMREEAEARAEEAEAEKGGIVRRLAQGVASGETSVEKAAFILNVSVEEARVLMGLQ